MTSQTLSRIVGPANIASGTSTLFTGTSGHIYTIKHMTIVNNSAGAIDVKLGVQTSAGTLNDSDLILPNATIDAGGIAEWNGTLILSGTEVIRASASATGLTFTASGLDQIP